MFKKGNKHGKRFVVKNVPWNKGRQGVYSKEALLKMSESRLGWKPSPSFKRRASLRMKGERNPSWKGGVSKVHQRIRNSLEYKIWRKAVFERDNFTCRFCGIRGGELNADHIKPFAYFPELRFAIDNGRTLCVKCHRTTYLENFKGISYPKKRAKNNEPI